MMKKGNFIYKIVFILVVLLSIAVIVLTPIRLMMTPLYPMIEYRMPGFPEDRYGFTQEERLLLAPLAIEYLFNDQSVEFLNDTDVVVFDDGSSLYNERELSHMDDVKVLMNLGVQVWVICLAIFVGVMLWAWQKNWLAIWMNMVSWGGMITIGLMFALGAGIAFGFDALFTQFHHLFFDGDSWLFYTSDTLIRLFPMRFWRDAFIGGGAMIFILGLLAWRLPQFETKK